MEKQIIETIKKMFSKVDEQEWQLVKSTMSGKVYLDLSSLSGVPAAWLPASQIVGGWALMLSGFDKTNHHIHNFSVITNDKIANVHYSVKAEHFSGDDTYTVEGTYDTELELSGGQWLLTKHRINLGKISGDKSLPEKAGESMKGKTIRKVEFKSGDLVLKGNLHLPVNFSNDLIYTGIIVTGSWTTVKEQMPDWYAGKLALEGFVALTFDFSNYGESEGRIRNYENPDTKSQDIINAVKYLKTLPFISPDEVGGMAICASSGYMAQAIAQGADIKALALIAPWLHNSELVAGLYGGEEEISKKLELSKKALKFFNETGRIDYVPAASKTDKNAAMFGPFDYYFDPQRGAIKQWANQFAVMAWEGWLKFDPIPLAEKINIPTLIVHSMGAAIPAGAEQFYKKLGTIKNMIWFNKTTTQFDFYDQEPVTSDAVSESSKWYSLYLTERAEVEA